MKSIRATILIAVAVFMGACSKPSRVAEPIKIGVWGALSGGSSPVGVSMLRGVEMEAAAINGQGGLLGRRLVVIARDDQSNNDRSAQVIRDLIFQEHVDFLLGPVNTGCALASLPVAQQNGIPTIVPVATGTKLTHLFDRDRRNVVFRVAAYDQLQARLIAEAAVLRMRRKRPAIIADSSNYGQLGRGDLEAALERLGVPPAASEKFNVGDIDMAPQVSRARAANADVLLLYGIGPELAQIANAAGRLGWPVPKIGCWNFAMSSFLANSRENAEGAIAPEAFILDRGRLEHRQLLADYSRTYNEAAPPSPIALAQARDAVRLLAAAVRQAGTTSSADVITALENLHEPVGGFVTVYKHPFSAGDHEALTASNVRLAIVRKGVVVPWDESTP